MMRYLIIYLAKFFKYFAVLFIVMPLGLFAAVQLLEGTLSLLPVSKPTYAPVKDPTVLASLLLNDVFPKNWRARWDRVEKIDDSDPRVKSDSGLIGKAKFSVFIGNYFPAEPAVDFQLRYFESNRNLIYLFSAVTKILPDAKACGCIHRDFYSYPACYKSTILGNYEAIISVHFSAERCTDFKREYVNKVYGDIINVGNPDPAREAEFIAVSKTLDQALYKYLEPYRIR